MIKTETKRFIIKNNVQPPLDALNALRRIDSALELIYDIDADKWNIYRLKVRGAVPDEDVLHFQMAAPETGVIITPSIATWLQQFDSTNGGMKDQDELRKGFMRFFFDQLELEEKQKQKRLNEISYSWKDLIQKAVTDRCAVAVPRVVGMHRGKAIRAFKRNKVKNGSNKQGKTASRGIISP